MKKSRILLVDDNKSNLELLREFLKHYFECELLHVSVRNGQEAMKLLTNEDFDLVISD